MSARRTAYVVVGSLLGIAIRAAPSCDRAEQSQMNRSELMAFSFACGRRSLPSRLGAFRRPGPGCASPLGAQVSGWQTADLSLAHVAQRAPTANTRRAAMLAPDRTGNGSSAVGTVR